MSVPRPDSEPERLQVLRRYDILDTGPEDAFDDLARLAAHICEAPMATVAFVDEGRVWAKAGMGFPFREWSRDEGFSSYAINSSGLTVVRDAQEDDRFISSPLVTDEPHVWQEWERCRDSGEPYLVEYRMLHEDGRIVWVSERAVILRNADAEPWLVQGVLMDITERKRVEEELEFAWQRERTSAEHLRALDDLKNTLLHAVSHDLRGPITAVTASAQVLDRMGDDLSSDERQELVHGISASARKLNRLVTDLLDFDRLDRGIVEPDPKRTHIGEILPALVPHVEEVPGREVELALQ